VNFLLWSIQAKAERALSNGWVLEPFSRNWDLPQSAVSKVLSNALQLGDAAFHTRIPDMAPVAAHPTPLISAVPRSTATEIDLNKAAGVTLEEVRALVASRDDSKYVQLRVSNDGIAFFWDGKPLDGVEDCALRFEGFAAGNDYVGAEAAKDEEWVRRIHTALTTNWEMVKDMDPGQGLYIDDF
jgi:hypothetical protein